MRDLKDINLNTPEGIVLLAAVTIITTNPRIIMHGFTYEGTKMEPDQALRLLYISSRASYMQYWQSLEQLQAEAMDNMNGQPEDLTRAIARLINQRSRENQSNTPDFILAEFMVFALELFERASLRREQWYGKSLNIEYDGASDHTADATSYMTGNEKLRSFSTMSIEEIAAEDQKEREKMFDTQISKLGTLYEMGKDLINRSPGNLSIDPAIFDVLKDMRDMCAVLLKTIYQVI